MGSLEEAWELKEEGILEVVGDEEDSRIFFYQLHLQVRIIWATKKASAAQPLRDSAVDTLRCKPGRWL